MLYINNNNVKGEIKLKRVVAYLRLSVEDGDDNESQSISNQRKIILKYAKENEHTEGYKVLHYLCIHLF